MDKYSTLEYTIGITAAPFNVDYNFTYWYLVPMKNELSHPSFYGFTITDAAARSGLPYVTVWRHFKKHRAISPETAIRYNRFLGIPLSSLRPDLWPPTLPSTPTEPEEVDRAG